jgi:hypothetical protein
MGILQRFVLVMLILSLSAPATAAENGPASRRGFSLLAVAAVSPSPTVSTVWGGGLEGMYTWPLSARVDANIPLTIALGGNENGLLAITSGFLFGIVTGETKNLRLVFLAGPEIVGILVSELRAARADDGTWLHWGTNHGGWGIGARGGVRVVLSDTLVLEANALAAAVPSPEPFYLLSTFGAGFLF